MVSIPFGERLSQEIRWIARTAGNRCTFSAPNILKTLYSVKDWLPEETAAHAVYSIKCKSCNEEYVSKALRQIGIWKKEHMDAVWLGQLSRPSQGMHITSSQPMRLTGPPCKSSIELNELNSFA